MDEDSKELFEYAELVAHHLQKFVLDHFVYLGSNFLNWSEDKVLIFVDKLVAHNKIRIENNIIYINKKERLNENSNSN